MSHASTVFALFACCVSAIRDGRLIHRESSHDKEFHFQNWLRARLDETRLHYETGGRNSFPDFQIVQYPEGYEVKGLGYPGREQTYDCNSQVPSGCHNGRTIFYVFGRYPATADGETYPVIDLVICHGDFLNADHQYVHRNKSIRGFGTYGDIMIRDRKMYVAPTPFGLLSGVAHSQTLLLPADSAVAAGYAEAGVLTRREGDLLTIGYRFDLRANTLTPETVPNPYAGQEHVFRAWRLAGSLGEPVAMRELPCGSDGRGGRDE